MYTRLLVVSLACLLFGVSAFAQPMAPVPDAPLRNAALRMKDKDYRAVRDELRSVPPSPERTFLDGVAARRLEQWPEASELLGVAAKDLPLLADYALFWQAEALMAATRYDEAEEVLQRLVGTWPDSPTLRKARMLLADAQFARKEYRQALASYIRFIELYPSGTDSVTANLKTALCREGLDDPRRAVQELRAIWLAYPASPVAETAEQELKRLEALGFPAVPLTPDELLKRGTTLYNLGKYERALAVFNTIPLKEQLAGFNDRVALKIGETLLKLRRYKDAARTFSSLIEREPKREIADEARFLLARAQNKAGNDDEAFLGFLKLAETAPTSEWADNALLEAAFVRKFQGRYADQLAVLEKLLTTYPGTKLKPRAMWETAWARYNTGDYRSAAESFRLLTASADYRERALYWHGRSLQRIGEETVARQSFAMLAEEYPFSFYTFTATDPAPQEGAIPLIVHDLRQTISPPAGHERARALIAMGLHDQARSELSIARKNGSSRGKGLLGIARLYLEMNDYSSAAAALRGEQPRRMDGETATTWGLLYPRGFSDSVAAEANRHTIPEELIYGLIKAESGFSPVALSPVGAVGLMQLMPSTAKGMVNGSSPANGISARLTDPTFNVGLGVRHLKDLLKQYNGNVVSAVAAYNAGSRPVDRWRRSLAGLREDEFIENIPYYETREYVKKVLTFAEVYRRLYRPAAPALAFLPPVSAPEPPQPAPTNNAPPTAVLASPPEAAVLTAPVRQQPE
ncbi:tetratricopeptide repeat protein [Geobacter sulfurreducens]|uniref:tetratricopeptide repeat protein n=1 Tax=Geobacter sulfurreducens TaxID=35554 RepID=UPI0020B6B51A|nr:tetratricopeptide repeat protein [Geobacter sulfurreducens]UTG94128.1 tetratricopeptide repeat protein [Geobacter sulfurreducens]